jgi:hypothetical protein
MDSVHEIGPLSSNPERASSVLTGEDEERTKKMQAVKDAGILLVLVILVATVRITPIEPAEDVDSSLLAPPAEAATIEPGPQPVSLDRAEVVERCEQIVIELKQDLEHPQQYVVVLEKEEPGEGAPCPRT